MMDPDQMTAAVQPDPEDSRYVTFEGRRMLRVRGGESVVADPAASGEGEGGAGGDAQAGGAPEGGLYDLSSVPEELRGYVENELKRVQGKVTQRFQEHAEFRKQWEPLSEVEGLKDVPKEELQELLQFHQIASDPEQFDGWMLQYLSALAEQAPERFDALFDQLDERGVIGDDDGEGDGDGPGAGGGEDIRSIISEALDERLGPIEERLSSTDQDKRVEEAKQQIQTELAGVKQKHQEAYGQELDESALRSVQQLALAYDGAEDGIERGYQDYLRLTGQAQGDLVDEKLGQPRPGVNGGAPDTTPEGYSADDPKLKQAALARMRAG